MYSLRSFKPSDAEQMSIQPMQVEDKRLFANWSDEEWDRLGAHTNPGMTGLRDGRIIFCAGVIPQWEGRAIAWALLGDSVNRYDMVWIHRQCQWILETQVKNGYHRIEAHIHEPFAAAHRWIRMLGFISEGLMRRYDPLGRDMRLYARIT